MQSIVIAAPMSGSGKTTITLGLMACLQRRGLVVAPFKVGPDFIDPGWHQLVTGRPSLNLDGWMCPEQFVIETFARHTQDTDIAVVEGVMGLFDGIDGVSDRGSTAQVAKIINAPVILVVDAKSQARSVAALVKGFVGFDPRVKIAGVIFNNVGSENHGRVLKEAVQFSTTGISVLGCIPRDANLSIPSRHLGLVTAEESPLAADFINHLAEVVEKHLDLEGILSLGGQRGRALTLDTGVQCQGLTPPRLAVARDTAFCFVYEDNLRLLREAGAALVEFSPLKDTALPEDISGVYLPGGYPELFSETLAANRAMRDEIRDAIESGTPVYAECGGFIYLTSGVKGQALSSDNSRVQCQNITPFVGIFPIVTRMLPRRKALGYREVELLTDTVVGTKGSTARGHEFHYSEMEEMPDQVERAFRVSKNGMELGLEGYRYKNCLASYIHLHFGSCPEIAKTFVESCTKFKNNQH